MNVHLAPYFVHRLGRVPSICRFMGFPVPNRGLAHFVWRTFLMLTSLLLAPSPPPPRPNRRHGQPIRGGQPMAHQRQGPAHPTPANPTSSPAPTPHPWASSHQVGARNGGIPRPLCSKRRHLLGIPRPNEGEGSRAGRPPRDGEEYPFFPRRCCWWRRRRRRRWRRRRRRTQEQGAQGRPEQPMVHQRQGPAHPTDRCPVSGRQPQLLWP